MVFDDAFAKVIEHEGGFSIDFHDRGNWTGGAVGVGTLRGTKFGISAAQYPGEDIAGMTLTRAAELYKRDFWGPAGCDGAPDELKFHLFDAAVNSGVPNAVRMLQRAVGETADGILGPLTLQAVQSMPPLRLVARFNGQRLLFMTRIPTWHLYGKGWAQRVAENLSL